MINFLKINFPTLIRDTSAEKNPFFVQNVNVINNFPSFVFRCRDKERVAIFAIILTPIYFNFFFSLLKNGCFSFHQNRLRVSECCVLISKPPFFILTNRFARQPHSKERRVLKIYKKIVNSFGCMQSPQKRKKSPLVYPLDDYIYIARPFFCTQEFNCDIMNRTCTHVYFSK